MLCMLGIVLAGKKITKRESKQASNAPQLCLGYSPLTSAIIVSPTIINMRDFVLWIAHYSPEKWLHNWIATGPNKSKKLTRRTSPAHTTHGAQVRINPTYVVFYSNFAAYILCRRYKPCEFLGLVWTDCWDNKSDYDITSPATSVYNDLMGQRTNTAKLNWLVYNVGSYRIIEHSLCDRAYVAWLEYRIGYLATLAPVGSMHRA